jgi:glucose-fructose oxidoreductase
MSSAATEDTREGKPAKRKSTSRRRKIRYAVVGLGHIAQVAVLPAFKNASRNSVLAALVSDDQTKLLELSEMHSVPHTFTDLDACLSSGEIDAIYIASPNHQHCEFTVRAAEAGIHVLCEKPMAVTAAECEKMIHAADASGVQLMIAYRLHFEPANLKAIQIAESGQLGDLRFFASSFSMQVKDGNIRLEEEFGGGTLYDIGIYCINAARYVFRSEPVEACAFSANSGDPRFAEVDETTSVLLRFPGERLATFTCSFGAADCGHFELVGTKGRLRVDPSYEYVEALVHHLTLDGKTTKKSFAKRDQFAPELMYFSDCVRKNTHPEPDGVEGLIDVKIIEALYESAKNGHPVSLDLQAKDQRPTPAQERQAPPVRKPELVHAEAPSA